MGVRKHGRVGERPRVTTTTLTPSLSQPLTRHQQVKGPSGDGQDAVGGGGAAGRAGSGCLEIVVLSRGIK
ncbi:hypothetical protein E2C01_007108 [Portunus trituberculatus]|uniref:Uncharacterized protein n=1 Tax=Portunus trituberculatus TaxID=210409 RepID=A0A5B7CZZ5_PORTR|nr:hypothetical protein [Portunus trituberculatus]